MKSYAIRANVRVNAQVKDRDLWAVDLVERSRISDKLKKGWFWATWPDRVELVFSIRADDRSIQRYKSEIERLVKKAPHIAGQPRVAVEERN